MRIQHLDHVAIVCADACATRDWYQSVFDMEWIYRGMWDNNPYFLQKGQARLALFQAGEVSGSPYSRGVGINHFAFHAETMNDYNEIKACLSLKGIPFEEQDHDISLSIYMKDPDGITVEVTTYDLE